MGGICKDRKCSMMIDIFTILITVRASWVYAYFEPYQIIPLKCTVYLVTYTSINLKKKIKLLKNKTST